MNTVFVALSGGVDSAVAAHMLREQGHAVVGVFIRVWQPDFIPCSQEDEEKAALRVAASLGIPFERVDLSEAYKREVVDDMIAQYKAGNTPNPDVLCNAHIKFGAFLEYARAHNAHYIATGHHAQVVNKDNVFLLKQGVDAGKDQSYFLWQLTQQELAQTYMPIGAYTKQEIREYAARHAIPSATKPDSQGLCFIGHVDMKTFLSHFIETTEGAVLSEAGSEIGRHDGAVFFTIGQRGGFTVTDKEALGSVYYVVAKDMEKNTITVSERVTTADTTATTTYNVRDVNFTMPQEHIRFDALTCHTRYHGEPITCSLSLQDDTNASVVLDDAVRVASGQSIVFYNDTTCVGGGIVA